MFRVVIQDGEGAQVLEDKADAVAILLLHREPMVDPDQSVPSVSFHYELEGFTSVFEVVGAVQFGLARMMQSMEDTAEPDGGANGHQAVS